MVSLASWQHRPLILDALRGRASLLSAPRLTGPLLGVVIVRVEVSA